MQLVAKLSTGQVIKKSVFSKLTSKVWPNIPIVVDSIAEYLPKQDFLVRLIDLHQDPHQKRQEEESKSNQKKPSKMKGMQVILRPVRVKKTYNNGPLFPESKLINDSL